MMFKATGSDNEEQHRANHGAKSELAPANTTIDEILRSLLDFSPSRFQRQMKDGSVKQLSGMDVFNEVKTQLQSLINTAVEEARIDEHIFMNARFSTSRSTSAATDQLSEGYNICRDEWSRISQIRIKELKAALQKERNTK